MDAAVAKAIPRDVDCHGASVDGHVRFYLTFSSIDMIAIVARGSAPGRVAARGRDGAHLALLRRWRRTDHAGIIHC